MSTSYHCPDCGSTDVELLVATWVNANTYETVDVSGVAELYNDTRWCPSCEKHTGPFVEEEVSE